MKSAQVAVLKCILVNDQKFNTCINGFASFTLKTQVTDKNMMFHASKSEAEAGRPLRQRERPPQIL